MLYVVFFILKKYNYYIILINYLNIQIKIVFFYQNGNTTMGKYYNRAINTLTKALFRNMTKKILVTLIFFFFITEEAVLLFYFRLV